MRVAVTGTPGTGKTTATNRLADRFDSSAAIDVVHCNEVIAEEDLSTDVDEERESVIADLDALADYLADHDDVVFESHLAHHLEADRVAVLRCRPALLETRLRERGESVAKATENAESEALDVILAEAVEAHGLDSVYEIDTSNLGPTAVADELAAVVRGRREPSAGTVDFVGYLT